MADAAKRRKLWDTINKFIRQEGGWVTSVPGVSVMRIEVTQGSSLPAKLIELGFDPRHVGVSTKLISGGTIETVTEHGTGRKVARHHAGFVPIDILEIELPG
jgi:hypothetical protein